MRIALVFLVAVTVMAQAGVALSSDKQAQGIQWAAGFDEALSQARTANKPVLLDFFNPN